MDVADRIDESLGRIAAKLTEARRRGLRCFGSQKHGFVLQPPLAEELVSRFEREHGVELPVEYRSFLTRLGNGGAGPYYGLEPLDRWDVEIQDAPAGLSRPSPLRPGMPDGADSAAYLGCAEDALTDGAITLVDQGCTYSSLLIVTGPNRGAVVNVDGDFSGPPYFCRDAGFLAWYERWLDELLWGWDGSWFGVGLPGTEPDLAAALLTSPEDRPDALRTLTRIPALTATTFSNVAACLDDHDPKVRAAAIALVNRQHTSASLDLIAGHLSDPVPEVRVAALAALPSDNPDTPTRLRAALSDADVTVVRIALRGLAEANQLRESDTGPLLARADPRIRACAVGFLGQVPEATVPAEVFSDPDATVVHTAVLTAGNLGNREAVPPLLDLLSASRDPELRSLVITILGRFGDPACLDALIQETRATDDFTRLKAARALGELGDRRARKALKALLNDNTYPAHRDIPGLPGSTFSVADVARKSLRQLPWTQLGRHRPTR